MDYLTLKEALEIVNGKPDEVDPMRQKMAIIRVQEFFMSL